MQTTLHVGGLRFVTYPNDYPPAHIHVADQDWEAVINLIGIELREACSYSEPDAERDAAGR